jgi:serine/threonine-protein kinase
MVTVPDFIGMTRNQAADAAGELGLYVLVSGNPSLNTNVTVSRQWIEKNTQVPAGTTVRLEFADAAARD